MKITSWKKVDPGTVIRRSSNRNEYYISVDKNKVEHFVGGKKVPGVTYLPGEDYIAGCDYIVDDETSSFQNPKVEGYGQHLTSTEKRNVKNLISLAVGSSRIGRKTYSWDRGGVTIEENCKDDWGRPQVRRSRVIIG